MLHIQSAILTRFCPIYLVIDSCKKKYVICEINAFEKAEFAFSQFNIMAYLHRQVISV